MVSAKPEPSCGAGEISRPALLRDVRELPQPRKVEILATLPAKAPSIVPIHNQAKAAAALFTAFHPDASSGASPPARNK